jgi:DNA repair exonuclease SbcCD ATPase subunit
MIIKKLRFRNIKSYGNKIQEITFDNKGGLVLLTGTNGAGKSTIQESLDIVVFNQVRGKESAKIPLKHFPNRLNNNLEVEVEFYNYNNDFIKMKRMISPNDFEMVVNHQPYTERFKIMTDTERENLIGFNYQTFKSFISMSMNDFLNFIHLRPEDKRNLLNRLFNLEDIDDFLSITKEFISQNKKESLRITHEIMSIDGELKDYMKIIKENKVENSSYQSKEDIKQDIFKIREKYNLKQQEIKKIKDKISDFQVDIQKNRNEISIAETENIQRRTELNEVKSKIKIFESGQCPYCDSKLKSHDHSKILNDLKEKDRLLTEKILENNGKVSHYRDLNTNIGSQSRVLESSISVLEDEFLDIKAEVKMLKDKYDNFDEDKTKLINDIREKGNSLLKSKKEKSERLNEINKDNDSLNKLVEILGDKGARKSIISSLIPPINENLKKLLTHINFPYEVNLNENFDADILDRNELTHPEMSSNGETRMLNICIAISYIQMVRKIKNINILFMDEVFQSVQKDNINLLLVLLKEFALENKIHLILVHHGLEEVDSKIFDRIISVEKDLFSDIKIN